MQTFWVTVASLMLLCITAVVLQVALDRQLWAAAAAAAVELLAQQPEEREARKLLAHAVQVRPASLGCVKRCYVQL